MARRLNRTFSASSLFHIGINYMKKRMDCQGGKDRAARFGIPTEARRRAQRFRKKAEAARLLAPLPYKEGWKGN